MRCGLERPPACVLRQLACPLYSALLISTANTIFEEGPQQPFMQTASPINTPFSGLSSDISISAEVPDGQAGASPHHLYSEGILRLPLCAPFFFSWLQALVF